jgi:glycosyltransferase involved in cell wall biosynthesis
MEKDRTDTLRVISHSYNRGYGAGIKTGISNSLFDTVVIIDGDGTYPEDSLPLLLKESHDADMVIGARAGKSKSIPLFHKIAKRVLNILANYLTRCAIKDINSGFRVMDKAIINKFMNILPDGFSFTSTITLAMHINGYKVKYMPISYYKRTGRSKISPVYQVFNFLQLIVRTVMYFDPLRVFLPLSAIFFIVSFIGFMYRAIEGKGLGVFTIMMFIAGMQFLTAGMLADLINKKTR